MALIIEDRVMETSTTTGTGDFSLAGAVAGFRDFDSVMANGDTCYYLIEAVDANGVPTGDWETGLGTFNDTDTLVRTTVSRSSNSNAAVSFAAGTKRVTLAATTQYLEAETFEVLLSDPLGQAIVTGDGQGYIRITTELSGMNLVGCGAVLDTAGSGGGYLMQLRRKRSGSDVDMLSTRISIDSGENDSADAGTPPAIDTSNDDVLTGDLIYFDRDGVPTGAKGDLVWLRFSRP